MHKSEKFWDRMSKTFDGPTVIKGSTTSSIVNDSWKHLRNSDIILDVGCATGTKTMEIADYVKEAHGIDISSKMINIAKRRVALQKIENCHFSQSTLYDHQYKDGSFDVIFAFNILHLVVDTHKEMKKINELLKPGGYFISKTPCMGEKMKWLRLFVLPISKIGILPDITFLKIVELIDSIAQNEFQIIESEKSNKDTLSYFIVAKKKLV